MGDVLIMKQVIKRGHIYSIILMAVLAGSIIGYSKYRELPPQVSEVFMAIGAMMILFVVLFVAVYSVYLLTSLIFGIVITLLLKVKNRRKDDARE
ncbi:hypothetical protein vBSscSF1_118 [Staphylococcus phage vB-SscS-F1]|nr:hypothetical protein vBApySJF1_118 [Arcanobacterium phage vB-ApyS-JF1]